MGYARNNLNITMKKIICVRIYYTIYFKFTKIICIQIYNFFFSWFTFFFFQISSAGARSLDNIRRFILNWSLCAIWKTVTAALVSYATLPSFFFNERIHVIWSTNFKTEVRFSKFVFQIRLTSFCTFLVGKWSEPGLCYSYKKKWNSLLLEK